MTRISRPQPRSGGRGGSRRLPRWITAVAAALTVALTTAGCTLSPANMDLRNPLADGGQYRIAMEFEDVLNLPIGARVAFGGMNVGRITSVDLGSDSATVGARIDKSTQLPTDVHASIAQDTLLGEAYVRLELPRGAQPDGDLLTAGSVLPLTQTSPPRSVENTLTVLANYFGSGSVEELSSAIKKLNTSLPRGNEKFTDLTVQIGADVTGLAAGTEELNRTLDAAVDTFETMASHNQDFKYTLTPYHMEYWRKQGALMSNIGVLLPAVGSMFEQGFWLIPLMDSSSDLFELLTADMVSLGDAIHGGSVLINESLVPFVRKPTVQVDSVVSADGQKLDEGAVKVLRMLGQAR